MDLYSHEFFLSGVLVPTTYTLSNTENWCQRSGVVHVKAGGVLLGGLGNWLMAGKWKRLEM